MAKSLEKKVSGVPEDHTPPEDEDEPKKLFQPSIHEFKPYPPSIVGLLTARNDCRMEMVKIVNEVGQLALAPDIRLTRSGRSIL